MARCTDAEYKLLQYSYEANRSATHHRALQGDYGYSRILGIDLVQLCLAAFEKATDKVRVLDIGCGDGWALHQLQREMRRRGLDGHFEFFGLGMNRYPDMHLDSAHFIHSGINQLVYDGPKFDLAFSVFTFHYVWHKLEAIEKVYNHLLAPQGEAHVHFPGFLVRLDDEGQLEEELGNERFGKEVRSFAMRERNPDVQFHVSSYTNDSEDSSRFGSFGVLSVSKSDKWLDCGLLYNGCDLVSHRSDCVYVASSYLRRRTLFGRTGFEKFEVTRRMTTSTQHVAHYQYDVTLDLCVHSNPSHHIVIIYPGASRDVDGIHGRFKAVAAELQDKHVGAIVRTNNPFIRHIDYPSMLRENLTFIVDYVLEHAEEICGNPKPSLYLMGHSAGASAIGAIASAYPQIEKILLLAPSLDAGKDEIRNGLRGYRGEMYVVVGMDDKVVLPVQSKFFHHVAGSASEKKFVALWNCDHDFSGPRNYDLLRKAPLWAFYGDREFPEDHDPLEPQDLIYRYPVRLWTNRDRGGGRSGRYGTSAGQATARGSLLTSDSITPQVTHRRSFFRRAGAARPGYRRLHGRVDFQGGGKLGVSHVTSARAGIVSGLLQSMAGRLRTHRAAAKSDGADAGPAFLLGGKAPTASSGVYDATGLLLNTATGQAQAEGASPQSNPEHQRHQQALASAAASIKKGDLQAGRAELQTLLDKDPADTVALRFMGHSYMAERDYQRAERLYARASSLDPQDERARDDLLAARTLQKPDAEALAEVRQKLQSPSHRVESLRLLFKLSERSPRNADVYLALADGFKSAGKPLQVVGALQEALRHADQQQIGGVIERARAFAGEHPQVGLAHNILGRSLAKGEQYGEAIRQLKSAQDLAPENLAYAGDLAGAYVARARQLLGAGSVESAETDLHSAQRIDPTVGGVSDVYAGVAAIRAGRDVAHGLFRKAAARLNSVASNPPDDLELKEQLASVFMRIGIHHKTQGDNTLALDNYERAYALDPDSAVARRNVGELSHAKGVAALNAYEYDNAVRHLERSYDTYRADASNGQDLARAYDARGQRRVSADELADAIVDFKKGIAADPTNMTLSAHYAAALALRAGT